MSCLIELEKDISIIKIQWDEIDAEEKKEYVSQ